MSGSQFWIYLWPYCHAVLKSYHTHSAVLQRISQKVTKEYHYNSINKNKNRQQLNNLSPKARAMIITDPWTHKELLLLSIFTRLMIPWWNYAKNASLSAIVLSFPWSVGRIGISIHEKWLISSFGESATMIIATQNQNIMMILLLPTLSKVNKAWHHYQFLMVNKNKECPHIRRLEQLDFVFSANHLTPSEETLHLQVWCGNFFVFFNYFFVLFIGGFFFIFTFPDVVSWPDLRWL